MRIVDCVQGTPEWKMARLGIPTASRFGKIITASHLKYSTASKRLIAELLVEKKILSQLPANFLLTDGSDAENIQGWDPLGNPFMIRGTEMEEEARDWYALRNGVDVQEVGLCLRDDGDAGCSPDGLVGDDGMIEIKVRNAENHMIRLLGLETIADRTQVQGSLWVTGRAWCDEVAYHPTMPKRIHRQHRDGTFMAAMDECFEQFKKDLAEAEALYDSIDGCLEDDNLAALLVASLKVGKQEDPDRFDLDEIDAFRRDLNSAEKAGILSGADVSAFVGEVEGGNWPAGRSAWQYVRRSLETEET